MDDRNSPPRVIRYRPPDEGKRLSPRETEILHYLPSSIARREIAERLQISRHTVESHLMQMYRKLGVQSRHEAVWRAVQLGLLDDRR